jgi:type VI protein secretion system component Hcp
MVAKTRKTLGKSKQSGSSRKPKNLDLPSSHAGAVKGGEVDHSEFVITKKGDKSSLKLFEN